MAFHSSWKYEPLPDSLYSQPSLAPANFYQPAPYGQQFEMSDFKKGPIPSMRGYSSLPSPDLGPGGYHTGLEAPPPEPTVNYKTASWRAGARAAAAMAAVSLLINLGVGVWAARRYGLGSALVELFRGDCRKVQTMSTVVHLAINSLSTALLSGSNYCMQCLSAPSRKEVDEAHARRKWLDIGVQSVRNLGGIRTKKILLWWLLGLSSVPLHLMYNSAFYSSLTTNDYNIVYATSDFITGAEYENTNAIGGSWQPGGFDPSPVQQNISRYENLTNAQCIQAYANDFITNRRTVVVISSNSSTNSGGSLLGSGNNEFRPPADGYDPYTWICSGLNLTEGDSAYNNCYQIIATILADASAWTPQDFAAEYCLSERIVGSCGFSVNLVIVLVVVICNCGKLAGMLYVGFGPLDDPLVTIGDAVSSFLQKPDESTKGMCIATKKDIVSVPQGQVWGIRGPPKAWKPGKSRWFSAASKSRWLTCILLFLTALLIIGILLAVAINSLYGGNSIKDLYGLGFGQVHSQTLINGWSLDNLQGYNSITANILIANTPQAILSFLYLTINGLFTSMFLADEWSHFADQRKSLRVSRPLGRQRLTYFLQLPYRIAIPLIIMSGLLHWLVSQSIFLAVVAHYDEVGNPVDLLAVSTCGFSPFAMICVMMMGGCMIIFALFMGFRRFNPEIPLVGSCSAAISAACHGAPLGAAFEPLQWGVMSGEFSASGVPHCGISSGEVSKPVSGQEYSGVLP